MPDFELDEPNKLLVHIPRGKVSIAEPDKIKPQHHQKGSSCWYYSLNHLRPRFGKKIDQLVLLANQLPWLDTDDDFKTLQAGRRIEKLISEHRKKSTENEDSPAYLNEQNAVNEREIQSIREMLPLIGATVETQQLFEQGLQQAASLVGSNSNFSLSLAHQLFTLACVDAYHLQMANWQPQLGYDSLVNTLKTHGQLAVIGYFGHGFYNAEPSLSITQFGSYDTFFWPPSARNNERRDGLHAINIVGAELLDNKAYIYYLDPNHELSVNAPKIIYKISFEKFCAYLMDRAYSRRYVELISPFKSNNPALSALQPMISNQEKLAEEGTFVICGNESRITAMKQAYLRVMTRIEKENPDLLESHMEQSNAPAQSEPPIFPSSPIQAAEDVNQAQQQPATRKKLAYATKSTLTIAKLLLVASAGTGIATYWFPPLLIVSISLLGAALISLSAHGMMHSSAYGFFASSAKATFSNTASDMPCRANGLA